MYVVSVTPGDCNHPLGQTRMHSQRAYRFHYEATGDEGPDMARERRWPVEHVVYQRLELKDTEKEEKTAQKNQSRCFRAGGPRPRDDVC
jgi:hypothetical protein